MKKLTEKGILQKIVIFLIVIILFQFAVPMQSQAGEITDAIVEALTDLGQKMLIGTARVIAVLGDLVMSTLNNFMLGTDGFGSAMISQDALGQGSWFDADISVTDSSTSSVEIEESDGNTIVHISQDYLEPEPALLGSDGWEIPNFLYCPENIFSNNIALLDVNFLNPNTYTPVVEDGSRGSETATKKSKSIAESLTGTISNWYKAFRNIAIVVLLSILVYLGIRILISSSADDKAKYKETIKDWAIALCLVFAMHFIMSAIIMVVNQVNSLFYNLNNHVYINVTNFGTFKSNFMGVLRFLAQSKITTDAWAYTIMYLILIFFTISFTLQYLKRVLYIAFYTMISPLVAITYPIDKLGDGRSQAFNMWFKEYTMMMALQPIHLVLYTMLVSSALTLSIESPLYGIVAIAFLIPAEAFIKKLFGVQPEGDKGFGSFASGALTMGALNKLGKSRPQKNTSNRNGNKDGGNNSEGDNTKINEAKNPELDSFRGKSNNVTQEKQESQNLGNNNTNPYELSGGNDEQVNFSSNFPETADAGWGNDEVVNSYNSEGFSQNSEGGDYFNPHTDEYDSSYDPHNDSSYNPYEVSDDSVDINFADNNGEQEKEPEHEQEPEQEVIPENNQVNENTTDSYRDKKKIKRMINRNNTKQFFKGAIKGGVKAAKYTGKLGLKTSGAMFGASVGLATGIASGKGLEGALKGAATGAYAGSSIGTNVYNKAASIGNSTINFGKNVMQQERTEKVRNIKLMDGEKAALDYEKNHMSKVDKKRYNDMRTEYNLKNPNNQISKEDMRNKAFDYEKNGVKDKAQIFKGLNMENKYSDKKDIHENMVDVMKMSQKYGDDYIYDSKKSETLNKKLDAYGITGENRENFNELFYGVHGVDYKKEKSRKSRTNKPKSDPVNTEQENKEQENKEQENK